MPTAACNFSTAELQKMVWDRQLFSILTWKCASSHNGVQFLISPRRFNEPTFRLTRHTNHWKNTAFRDFSNIWRGWIFFLLTFALLHLLSSDSTSSSDFTFFWLYFISLLFICFSTLHIVGSLLFKLPSIVYIYILEVQRLFFELFFSEKTIVLLRVYVLNNSTGLFGFNGLDFQVSGYQLVGPWGWETSHL